MPSRDNIKEIRCTSHGVKPIKVDNFYMANEGTIYGSIGYITTCKTCMKKHYLKYLDSYGGSSLDAVYKMCMRYDIVFYSDVYNAALNESKGNNTRVFSLYMKNINSLKQYSESVWSFDNSDYLTTSQDSINEEKEKNKKTVEQEIQEKMDSFKLTQSDKDNINKVIKILGYNPFENYNEFDTKFLFEELNPYIDEDTADDKFGMGLILQVINNNHQIRKIDLYLNALYQNMEEFKQNSTLVNTLTTQKNKIAKINTDLLKNDIFDDSNRSKKSKLSEMMRYYRTIGFEEAEESIFDQKTCFAMRTVADISNSSIVEQLKLTEMDEKEMFLQQRLLIGSLEEEKLKLKDELVHLHRDMELLKSGGLNG